MGFSVNALTAEGLAFCASATATERAIFTRVLSSERAFTAAEASSATVAAFDGPAGPIIAASAVDGVARIVGAIRNAGTSEITLKSFALCGKIGVSGVEKIVAVLSDEQAAVILPPAGGPSNAVSVAFSLVFSAGSEAVAEVTEAGSATVSDLSRFVSLHKAGDLFAGDDQEILGTKAFSGNVFIEGKTTLHGETEARALWIDGDTEAAEAEDALVLYGDGIRKNDEYGAGGPKLRLTYSPGGILTKPMAELNSANVSIQARSSGNLDNNTGVYAVIGGASALSVRYDVTAGRALCDVSGGAGLYGTAPIKLGEVVNVPIGGIVLAWFNQTKYSAGFGESCTVSANSMHVCKSGASGFSIGMSFIPAGSYRILCELNTDSSAPAPALLQRIE